LAVTPKLFIVASILALSTPQRAYIAAMSSTEPAPADCSTNTPLNTLSCVLRLDAEDLGRRRRRARRCPQVPPNTPGTYSQRTSLGIVFFQLFTSGWNSAAVDAAVGEHFATSILPWPQVGCGVGITK
jgi:hypothetical protein